MMDEIRLRRGTKCRGCEGGVGTRLWLGDESAPRIAFCPRCDLPANLGDPAMLAPGAAAALVHATGGAA